MSPVALHLPFSASSAAVARSQLKEWLEGQQAPTDVIEDSRLVVSELVGNAVRHARPLDDGTVLVAWNQSDVALDIAVTDGGSPTDPVEVDAADDAVGGRGLAIVELVSQRWWWETSHHRSTVHALLSLTA